ncbi:hypothetical protein HK104_001721, partial [Borealophlyctis nickersoniae]
MLYGLILLDRFALFKNILKYPSWLVPSLFKALCVIFPIGLTSDLLVLYRKDWVIDLTAGSLGGFILVACMDMTMGPMMVRKALEIKKDISSSRLNLPVSDAGGSEVGNSMVGQTPTATKPVPVENVDVDVGARRRFLALLLLRCVLISAPFR